MNNFLRSETLLRCYRQLPWFKGKLRLGKKIFGSFINRKVPMQFIAHNGIKYLIPNTLENLGVELLINGVYEPEIVRFLQKHVKSEGVYFDIGANIGSIGLPIVKRRPGLRYYGFEASPVVFEYLQKNLKLNGIQAYHLQNRLVHRDDDQEIKFYQSELYGKSSLAPTYTNDFVMIQSVSVDSFCQQYGIDQIDWMKVDVQGFELYVFEGMESLLKQKKIANILFEFEEWAEEQAKVPLRSAQEKLKEWGYQLFDLQGRILDGKITPNDTMIWAKPVNQELC